MHDSESDAELVLGEGDIHVSESSFSCVSDAQDSDSEAESDWQASDGDDEKATVEKLPGQASTRTEAAPGKGSSKVSRLASSRAGPDIQAGGTTSSRPVASRAPKQLDTATAGKRGAGSIVRGDTKTTSVCTPCEQGLGIPAGKTKPLPRGDGVSPGTEQQAHVREANIRALLSNNLNISRNSIMPKILVAQQGEVTLRQPFKCPAPGAPARSNDLVRKLAARKLFVPWSKEGKMPLMMPKTPWDQLSSSASEGRSSQEEPSVAAPAPPLAPAPELPPGVEPLVLWEPPVGAGGAAVEVDKQLVRYLRPHQREGVQFMFECVMGLKEYSGRGCILADDMGLGKTLQGVTLLWTLLSSGHELLGGCPVARRVIVVCPTSLVSNWNNEIQEKWLAGKVRTLPLCESSREDVIDSVEQFLHASNKYKVLIISYETFRLHSDRFKGEDACDLLICDEAHRLKNDATLTNKALDSLKCQRRVLLSGTPMQNHLDEFFSMVDFCNPGVLGSPSAFHKKFELPILAGREPDATELQTSLGEERSAELSSIVNQFILRRTNTLLSQHLPPKVVQVVCCRMTDMQAALYAQFLESNMAQRLLKNSKAATKILSAITSLKKLCNHPKLIYDAMNCTAPGKPAADGFEGCQQFFPPGLFDNGRPGRGGLPQGWESLSGKFAVLARMLDTLFRLTDDRIVIVSNYTQTLDLVATLCRERGYPFLRLDGTTSIGKRQKLVKSFCDPNDGQFVFLLSSKAGGCGLNLIGGNRLILFDPDWNPANDKQAAARVWRDGQKKQVYVYRFLTTGTIEEKVFQRQLSKEGLSNVVNQSGKSAATSMSADELRDLFTWDSKCKSSTYDTMCVAQAAEEHGADVEGASAATMSIHKEQVGAPDEEDLKNWGHHSCPATVDDDVMQRCGGEDVTFVFTCHVAGKPVETKAGIIAENEPNRCPHSARGPGIMAVGRSSRSAPAARAAAADPELTGKGSSAASGSGRGHAASSRPWGAPKLPRLQAPGLSSPSPLGSAPSIPQALKRKATEPPASRNDSAGAGAGAGASTNRSSRHPAQPVASPQTPAAAPLALPSPLPAAPVPGRKLSPMSSLSAPPCKRPVLSAIQAPSTASPQRKQKALPVSRPGQHKPRTLPPASASAPLRRGNCAAEAGAVENKTSLTQATGDAVEPWDGDAEVFAPDDVVTLLSDDDFM